MKPAKPKPAVLYIRVSTEKQASEGVSLEAQLERLKAWCAMGGRELHSHWTDAGLSGGRADNRPALQEALAQVCECRGVLVVYSLSRLARSRDDIFAIAKRLKAAHADLVSLSENIDTTTAMGNAFFGFLAVLAQLERDLVAERTRMAMAALRAKGAYTGGGVPYGYARDEAGTIVPNPGEQGVLSSIKEMAGQGIKAPTIAAMLRAQGVPCRGARWHRKSVERILGRDWKSLDRSRLTA